MICYLNLTLIILSILNIDASSSVTKGQYSSALPDINDFIKKPNIGQEIRYTYTVKNSNNILSSNYVPTVSITTPSELATLMSTFSSLSSLDTSLITSKTRSRGSKTSLSSMVSSLITSISNTQLSTIPPASAPANTTTPSQTISQSSQNASGTSTTGSQPTSPSSGGSPGKSPTYQQFCSAVAGYSKTSAGGVPATPSQDTYNSYIQYVAGNYTIGEQAMFLANAIWETAGLTTLNETACSSGTCSYGNYYGRGYLQLTWDYNYQAASSAIYGNQSLYTNPDIASYGDGAWQTAVWFWKTNVHPSITNTVLSSYNLGVSVKIINGAIECPATATGAANNRLIIYNNILSIWGIANGNPGTLQGCN